MKTFNTSSVLLSALLILFAALTTPAQSTPPTIDVQGSAEVRVVPDEVYIMFGVETSDPKLAVAKSDNDARVKRFLALAQEMKIDPKFVQTDFIAIEPWEHEILVNGDRITRKEYRVRKNVAVTLRDVPKFEELLSRALEAGVNFAHGVQFRTTELRKHRDRAREMAIQAAKEKANLLAGQLNRQVGEAQRISEYGGGWYSTYNWWGQGYNGYANAMSQVSSQSGQSTYGEGTLALGQITVTASVSVSFLLR
ncbi:MAG TPA: SIMPL domain-containing protein [Pyrinomonadaceae bacterium]|nr:SIMPL domain-containing protein [Pyrinomonadaceae bacterium]